MATTINAIPVPSDDLPAKANTDLAHLPGPKGHWLTGNIRQILPNPGPFVRAQQSKYGNCFTAGFFRNQRAVFLTGPKANELVLLDRDDNFSSRWGWDIVHAFFGRNILVRDFEDHRQHRRLMTHVFKPGALATYLEEMTPIISTAANAYIGSVDVYRQTKQLVLEIAIKVFAGIDPGQDSKNWNDELNTVLSNAMAHRIRLPGTAYSKALKARNRLRARLLAELPGRRAKGGDDLFSQLATQADETGARLSDSDVVDHMFGMLFAAHDTTASSLGMMFWLLARHPEWQAELHEECHALFARTGRDHLKYEDLEHLPKIDWVFKEALRLYSPLQILPRRPVRDFEFDGHNIPRNANIYLIPQAVHFDSEYFAEPDVFNPARFSENNDANRTRSPHTFIPFGRGSHMCIGMHFAHMEIKAVIYQTLLKREISLKADTEPELEYLPIVRPEGALNVQFRSRD